MHKMTRLAKERGINRKLSSALKGSRSSLNRIEMPKTDWYYSAEKAEMYHYDNELFELYAAYSP